MSKKKSEMPAVTEDEMVIKSKTVNIIEMAMDVKEFQVPDEFQGSKPTTSFNPVADFQDPGDTIFGTFIEGRPDIGPNRSMLYVIEIGGSFMVSVWGSNILDAKIRTANPQRGDRILIGYIGEVSTSRNMNPAKDFHVIVKRK